MFSLIALVISSQVGIGIFLLPATFAKYGPIGLFGWVIAGFGAMLLAFVFAELCKNSPKTGGPHAYVRIAFGDTAAFFTGWAYWLISSISNVPVIIVGITYLTSIVGFCDPGITFALQLALLSFTTCLNLFGGSAAGKAELFFVILKIIPMLAVPVAAIMFCNVNYFVPFNLSGELAIDVLPKVSLLAMWSFIGIETATVPAESVTNASKIIPKALFIGTALVILIYLSNNVGIIALVPSNVLSGSIAPYAEVSKVLFPKGSGTFGLLLPFAVGLTCMGTVNSWTLSSSYVAYGLASERLFPRVFLLKNKFEAPYVSLMFAYVLCAICLVFCLNNSFKEGLMFLMGIEVVAFLIVYVLCILAFLKLQICKKPMRIGHLLLGVCSLMFCCYAIYSSGILSIASAIVLFLLGAPIYILRKKYYLNS